MTGLIPGICEPCVKKLAGARMDASGMVVYCDHTPPNLAGKGVLLITSKNDRGEYDSTLFAYLSEAEAKDLVQRTIEEQNHE